jgi:hypothetical protein
MQVHERVVADDDGLVALDEADAAHVGGQSVDLVDAARRLEAVVPALEVEDLELVRRRRFVFRVLDVDAANPVSLGDEIFDQVMADESAGAGHQDSYFIRHTRFSF